MNLLSEKMTKIEKKNIGKPKNTRGNIQSKKPVKKELTRKRKRQSFEAYYLEQESIEEI